MCTAAIDNGGVMEDPHLAKLDTLIILLACFALAQG